MKKYFCLLYIFLVLINISLLADDIEENLNTSIQEAKQLLIISKNKNNQAIESELWFKLYNLYFEQYILSKESSDFDKSKIALNNAAKIWQKTADINNINLYNQELTKLNNFTISSQPLTDSEKSQLSIEILKIKNKLEELRYQLGIQKPDETPDTNIASELLNQFQKSVPKDELESFVNELNLQYIKSSVVKATQKIWDDEYQSYKIQTQERQLEVKEGGKLFERDLPFNTHLSISGLKTVKITGTFKKYRNMKANDYRTNENDIKIEQTLKVRVEGKIGESVDVNIDYDDAQEEKDKQKLSIVYDGKEKALSKNEYGEDENIIKFDAGFGDIQLSLPGTEFLSYNKQLFGIRGGMQIRKVNLGGIKLNDFKLNFIASRTKGEPGHMQFNGQNLNHVTNISDINYIKKTYYQITELNGFDTPTIKPYSEKIYVDKLTPYDTYNTIIETCTNVVNGETYQGNFTLFLPGDNYTIDYQKGIVKFKTSINDNYVIMVCYETENGAVIKNKMIRRNSEKDFIYAYSKYELKNRYSIGSTKIISDDKNFIVEIQDNDNNRRTEVQRAPDKFTLLRIFGLDQKGAGVDGVLGTSDDGPDGRVDPEYIDNDFGILIFPDTQPFITPYIAIDDEGKQLANPTVYQPNQTARYNIYIQYQSEVQQFSLNAFNIVRNSETVKVDGRVMTRNVDYYLDYQTGFLVFLNSGIISQNSVIVIDYEKIPFGVSAEKTLIGTRIESDINDNFMIGTSYIMNKNDKAQEIPTLGNEPVSLTINDVNTKVNVLPFLSDAVNFFSFKKFKPELSKNYFDLNISAEVGKSIFDPNTYGKALIDNMESIKDALTLPISKYSYLPSFIPEQSNDSRGILTFDEKDDLGHDPDPASDETQKSLAIIYKFDEGDSWAAFRYPLAKSGVNLSKKSRLELWLQNYSPDSLSLNVEIGTISEDCDGDGKLDQEDGLCIDGNYAPNNPPNGVLNKNPNEDVGVNVNGINYGADNNILDGEDMNGNGLLDDKSFRADEQIYMYKNIELNADTEAGTNGWTFYSINLYNLITKDFVNQNADSTNIKHIRIWFGNKTSGYQKIEGTIYTDYIAIIGNKWLADKDNDTQFYAVPVNNKDNPGYVICQEEMSMRNTNNNDDEDKETLKEQAMEIVYNDLTETKWLNYDLGRTLKINDYNSLVFYIRNNSTSSTNDTLCFKFGDVNNYFQYRTPLPQAGGSWQQVTVNLKNLRAKLQEMISSDTPPGRITFDNNYDIVGLPNMKTTINRLSFGIIGSPAGSSGRVQVNNIYVSDANQREGVAKKISFTSNVLKDFINLSGSYYQKDSKFQMVGEITSATNQSYTPLLETTKNLNSTINLHKLTPASWQLSIPVTANFTRSKTEGEPDEVENIERNLLGYNEKTNNSYSLGIKRPDMPSLNFTYNENFDNSDYKSTKSEYTTKKFTSRADYSYSVPEKPLKNIPLLKSIPIIKGFTFGKRFSFSAYYEFDWDLDERNSLTGSFTNSYDKNKIYDRKISITHQPWNWITLMPSFKYMNKYHTTRNYEGLQDENYAAELGLDFIEFAGIKPNMKFTYTKNLNYNIAYSDSEPAKTISGTGNITIELRPEHWWKKINFVAFTVNTSANYSENLKTQQFPKTKDANITGSFSVVMPAYLNKLWKALKFLDIGYTFKNDISANYTDLNPDYSFNDIISDYFKTSLVTLTKRRAPTTNENISLQRKTASMTLNHSVSGGLNIWSPLSLRYNATMSDNTTQQNNSESFNKNFSANLNGALNLKQLNWLTKTQSATLSNDYVFSVTTQQSSKTINFKPRIGGQINWSDIFKTGIDIPYSYSKTDNTSNEILVTTLTTQISPSFRWSYLLNKPFNIENPLQSNLLRFKNRLELNGTVNINLNQQTQAEKKVQDTVDYNMSTGVTWDVHQNLRLSGSVNFQFFTDKVQDGMDYISYGFSVYGELRF